MTRWHLWTPKQKTAAAAVTLIVATIVVATAVSAGHPHPHRPAGSPPAHPAAATTTVAAGSGTVGQVQSAPTPAQTQIDSQIVQAQNPASIAKAETITAPNPATTRAYPAVPSAERGDPTAYARAFITELLDTRYATQTRAALLAWAESEAAADTLPGVPAAAGQNSLIGSLAYAGLPGAQPTPILAAANWPSLTSGTTQTVTGLTTSVDPAWARQIAQGWQPTDPLLTVIDITGTLTVTAPGRPPARHLFSLSLMLGTALHHPGYGAVAVANWTEAA
jgi:hypothetical protein